MGPRHALRHCWAQVRKRKAANQAKAERGLLDAAGAGSDDEGGGGEVEVGGEEGAAAAIPGAPQAQDGRSVKRAHSSDGGAASGSAAATGGDGRGDESGSSGAEASSSESDVSSSEEEGEEAIYERPTGKGGSACPQHEGSSGQVQVCCGCESWGCGSYWRLGSCTRGDAARLYHACC